MKDKNISLIATTTTPVFVVWSNTDLTEGRGREYAYAVCEKEATAIRLSKGAYVMGTDARYTEERAYYIKPNKKSLFGAWYIPGIPIGPSNADIVAEEKLVSDRVELAKFNEILAKVKSKGLSEEEIEILSNYKKSS